MPTGMPRVVALLRNRLIWLLAAAVALVFGIAYAFVQVKTRECELLCGESSRGKAQCRINATVGSRYPSKPATSACICAESTGSSQ